MKFPHFFSALLLVSALDSSAQAGTGVIDLTSLPNYAHQSIPAYITRNNTPANNQISDAGAAVGRILFYDKRLSTTNTVSCGSCHQQAHAFSDGATASAGVAGSTARHTMRLVNARFSAEVKFFWDERAASLEAQTTQPIQNHVEMGFSGANGDPAFSALVTRLSALAEYRVLFYVMFGDSTITEARVQFALAEFVRSIQSFDSKFDAGRAAAGSNNANFLNYTAAENSGKTLFLNGPGQGGAGCAVCHRLPEFDIDPNSLNNGTITSLSGATDLTVTRAPSLRDLLGPSGTPNGGFMHDGSLPTLADVIGHYNVIPATNTLAANFTSLDPRLRRPGNRVQNLNLTAQEQSDLVAFLSTLTGSNLYTDEKWSDPFDAQSKISVIVLPAGSITFLKNANGTLTVSCKAYPGLQYQLLSSPDLNAWSTVTTLTATPAGVCQQTVGQVGKIYYRFAYQIPTAPAGSQSALASLRTTTRTAARLRAQR